MVGGAVDSQMDYCNDLVGGTPSVAGGDRLLNETGGLYNGTTADPGMTMNYTTMFDGNSSTTMAPNSAGPSNDPTEAAIDSPINLCRMGVVTTLTLLVGIFQVIIPVYWFVFWFNSHNLCQDRENRNDHRMIHLELMKKSVIQFYHIILYIKVGDRFLLIDQLATCYNSKLMHYFCRY